MMYPPNAAATRIPVRWRIGVSTVMCLVTLCYIGFHAVFKGTIIIRTILTVNNRNLAKPEMTTLGSSWKCTDCFLKIELFRFLDCVCNLSESRDKMALTKILDRAKSTKSTRQPRILDRSKSTKSTKSTRHHTNQQPIFHDDESTCYWVHIDTWTSVLNDKSSAIGLEQQRISPDTLRDERTRMNARGAHTFACGDEHFSFYLNVSFVHEVPNSQTLCSFLKLAMRNYAARLSSTDVNCSLWSILTIQIPQSQLMWVHLSIILVVTIVLILRDNEPCAWRRSIAYSITWAVRFLGGGQYPTSETTKHWQVKLLTKRTHKCQWWGKEWFLKAVGIFACFMCVNSSCTDIGMNFREKGTTSPGYECINYNSIDKIFSVSCSFSWPRNYTDQCIILLKNEIFEGGGHTIDLTNLPSSWKGLIRIANFANTGSAPTSLENAPTIRNIHTFGGTTIESGGFIIQAEQRHFIVDSCSSSGVIKGGGICGAKCSGDIFIVRCWTTGSIETIASGGIAGSDIGLNGGGKVIITQSYSTGDIMAQWGGGICGYRAGFNNDKVVLIKQSYSTGKIQGHRAGGICGSSAGYNSKSFLIEQCYSLGEIGASQSGGITGAWTGNNGHLIITNCYSRGDITGSSYSGGICSEQTGINGGSVSITNVYSTGQIVHSDAGGIIGRIHASAAQILVSMSVYNGGPMVSKNESSFISQKNSGFLEDIINQVYCYNQTRDGKNEAECWNSQIIWQAVESGFPLLLPPSSPTPTPTSTYTPTTAPSSIQTGHLYPYTSQSSLPTTSQTASPTVTLNPTSSILKLTHTGTGTVSVTMSSSWTPSFTASSSGTQCCKHVGKLQLRPTWQNPEILASSGLIALVCLLIMYVGYKRLQNKRRHAANSSDVTEFYARHLGVKFRSRSPCSDDENNNAPLDYSDRQRRVNSIFAKPISVNPLVRVQEGKVHCQGNSPQVSVRSPELVTEALPFMFLDVTTIGPSNVSKVKILSAKQPDVNTARRNGSVSSGNRKIIIARISEVDTSQMGRIDRTIIKLRKWKAKLLAEPPPVVEVSVPAELGDEADGAKATEQRKPFSQFAFANGRDDDRTAINNEISEYTKSRRGGLVKKKEFTAAPRWQMETTTKSKIVSLV